LSEKEQLVQPEVQAEEQPPQKSLLRIFLSGFAMGSADVVPGVSGGTVAFVLGVYDELLQAISNINLHFIRLLLQRRIREAFGTRDWRFLAALGAGLGVALLTMSRVLVWALDNHTALVMAFVFGLVLASALVVAKRMPRWTPPTVLIAAVSTVAAYLLFGMMPVETPTAPWFLFLSGAVAICAIILPGISGAFILLILGKYHYLLESLVTGNWLPLIIVAAGAAVGLLMFARFLRWLLKHYHNYTVAAMIGLVVGGLRKVWPWKVFQPGPGLEEASVIEINVLPQVLNGEVVLALAVIALGVALVFGLELAGSRHNQPAGQPEAARPDVA